MVRMLSRQVDGQHQIPVGALQWLWLAEPGGAGQRQQQQTPDQQRKQEQRVAPVRGLLAQMG